MRFGAKTVAKGLRTTAFVGATLALALAGSAAQSPAANESDRYANAHPYFDEPLPQLIKRVPELKHLQPAQSQAELPVILQKTGERVDDFFRHITDLTAREDISLTRLRQELPSSRPELSGERVRDSYLILRHGSKTAPTLWSIAPTPRATTSSRRW